MKAPSLKPFDWRKIVFAIAIALLFIPMVFLGVNTFFPKPPMYNNCYDKFSMPVTKNLTDAEWQERSAEQRICDENFQKEMTKYDGGKFVTIMIICIIASFVMLLNLDKSIIYGLFFGVVITAFSGTIGYIESRSKAGFALMVFLFILIIFWIQRERQKPV